MICVYVIQNEHGRCYVGCTKYLKRRLRQHRGVIKGGAKATRSWKEVHLIGFMHGFPTWSRGLSYEWHTKRRRKRNPLERLLTPSKLPKFHDLSLTLVMCEQHERKDEWTKEYSVSCHCVSSHYPNVD